MSKSSQQLNEIISLTVMLLMIIALVAAQAETRAAEPAAPDAVTLTLESESGHFRLDDE